MILKYKLQQRYDTAANWLSANPVLLVAEYGIISDSKSGEYKIGDGHTTWNELKTYKHWDGTNEGKFVDAYTRQECNDKFQLKGNYLESIPTEYVTDTELNLKGYLNVGSLNGYAKESWVTQKIADAQLGGGGSTDTSGFATKEDLNLKADKSELSKYQLKGNYLTAVPEGYAKETWVASEISKAQLAGGNVDVSSLDFPKYGVMVNVGNTVTLLGASFASVRNGWFELMCKQKGLIGNNKAADSSSIWSCAEAYMNGNLLTPEDIENTDALIIMHVHDKDVFESSELKTDYTEYTSPLRNYAAGFDYVIKRYRAECLALKDNPSSKYYQKPYGKPCQILFVTHWHDGRPVYNASIRKLASKWQIPLVELDKNIGFTKDLPINGVQVSTLYASNNLDGFGWHPRTGEKEYIQLRIAAIVGDKVHLLNPNSLPPTVNPDDTLVPSEWAYGFWDVGGNFYPKDKGKYAYSKQRPVDKYKIVCDPKFKFKLVTFKDTQFLYRSDYMTSIADLTKEVLMQSPTANQYSIVVSHSDVNVNSGTDITLEEFKDLNNIIRIVKITN